MGKEVFAKKEKRGSHETFEQNARKNRQKGGGFEKRGGKGEATRKFGKTRADAAYGEGGLVWRTWRGIPGRTGEKRLEKRKKRFASHSGGGKKKILPRKNVIGQLRKGKGVRDLMIGEKREAAPGGK